MRSELFRIPYEVGGVPLFGFGLLLLFWAVAALATLGVVARRRGVGSEFWSYVPMFAIGAAVIVGLPHVFEGGMPIRGYGVMLLLGSSAGIALVLRRAPGIGVDSDTVFSLAFWMFICGIIGARAFFVIEYWDEQFAGPSLGQSIKNVLSYTEGGLVVYGSLIGAGAAFFWFMRRRNLPTLAMADLIAPAMVIGLAFGRIGCFLNGCCYGGLCDAPWAVSFPPESPPYADQVTSGEMHGLRLREVENGGRSQMVVAHVSPELQHALGPDASIAPGGTVTGVGGQATPDEYAAALAFRDAYKKGGPVAVQLAGGERVIIPAAPIRPRSLPVHPTQLYSAVNAALLAWFLWSYYPLRRRDGEVIGLALTIYPVGRFLLEVIRTDESAMFGTGLSISQNVSIVILLAMIPYWLFLLRRPPRSGAGRDIKRRGGATAPRATAPA